MKSTIRVCVVYSRDLAGMPMVTHGSENFREPQPGSENPQTAKTANNRRRVKYLLDRIIGIYILPLSSHDALSETRIRLRHLPQSFEPRFLANTGPRRKPSSRGIFSLLCILSLLWLVSSVYIYIYYRYPPMG